VRLDGRPRASIGLDSLLLGLGSYNLAALSAGMEKLILDLYFRRMFGGWVVGFANGISPMQHPAPDAKSSPPLSSRRLWACKLVDSCAERAGTPQTCSMELDIRSGAPHLSLSPVLFRLLNGLSRRPITLSLGAGGFAVRPLCHSGHPPRPCN
jgi:hypothetical protein